MVETNRPNSEKDDAMSGVKITLMLFKIATGKKGKIKKIEPHSCEMLTYNGSREELIVDSLSNSDEIIFHSDDASSATIEKIRRSDRYKDGKVVERIFMFGVKDTASTIDVLKTNGFVYKN